MHRIFISDLHLEDISSNAYARFAELLKLESRDVDEIYVLGDLVEMWIGDDDDSPLAQSLAADFHSASQSAKIFLMHGNRDFLFGARFAATAGLDLLADPHRTADGLVLSHGDALCTDDQQYQTMRAVLRSDAWQQDILSKSLAERKAIGTAMRNQSQQHNANKPTNIMDVNAAATDALVAQHGSDEGWLIHGHTHRPGIHRQQNRIVLGAWERCGWLCRQQNQQVSLECFTLARHYGT